MTELQRAIQIAKQSVYDGARHIGKWKGYEVYEPTFSDNEPRFIGFPQFILAKGDTMRWTDELSETRAIMRKFSKNE